MVLFFIFLFGIVAAVEAGVNYITVISAVVVIVIVFAVVKWVIFGWLAGRNGRPKAKKIEAFRGGLSTNEAKFIVANHLLNKHNINTFTAGTTSDTAQYTHNIQASRVYPTAGEEMWIVRLIINDKRYFNGVLTKVLYFVDGMGDVAADLLMNENTFLNNELWRNPELFVTRGVSKTSKPRSIKEMIARHIEETGELPAEIQPSFIQPTKEEKEEGG